MTTYCSELCRVRRGHPDRCRIGGRDHLHGTQMGRRLEKVAHGIHACALSERSLPRIRGGYEDVAAGAGRRQGCGQGSADRADVAFERQLAEHFQIIERIAGQLS